MTLISDREPCNASIASIIKVLSKLNSNFQNSIGQYDQSSDDLPNSLRGLASVGNRQFGHEVCPIV